MYCDVFFLYCFMLGIIGYVIVNIFWFFIGKFFIIIFKCFGRYGWLGNLGVFMLLFLIWENFFCIIFLSLVIGFVKYVE